MRRGKDEQKEREQTQVHSRSCRFVTLLFLPIAHIQLARILVPS